MRLLFILLLPTLCWAQTVRIAGDTGAPLPVNATATASGVPVYLANTLAGEDSTNSVFKVEGQFSSSGPKTADAQIKASSGFVHTVTCAGSDAAATAGTIILYDSLTETGTSLWTWDVQAVALTSPVSVILDNTAATGLYLGYTTTADVKCVVSYR